MFEKNLPGFRQRNSVFRAIKKRHSDLRFQRFDLKCDRRLCEVESFGSLSEVQLLGNCAEALQSEVFHFGSSCKSLPLSAHHNSYLTPLSIVHERPKGHLPTKNTGPGIAQGLC